MNNKCNFSCNLLFTKGLSNTKNLHIKPFSMTSCLPIPNLQMNDKWNFHMNCMNCMNSIHLSTSNQHKNDIKLFQIPNLLLSKSRWIMWIVGQTTQSKFPTTNSCIVLLYCSLVTKLVSDIYNSLLSNSWPFISWLEVDSSDRNTLFRGLKYFIFLAGIFDLAG